MQGREFVLPHMNACLEGRKWTLRKDAPELSRRRIAPFQALWSSDITAARVQSIYPTNQSASYHVQATLRKKSPV
jgi:hypothetical protein